MKNNFKQCKFCRQVTTYEEHEQDCLLNPQTKSCLTCSYKKSDSFVYNNQYKNQYTCNCFEKKPLISIGEIIVSCKHHKINPIPTSTYNKYQKENVINYSSFDTQA